MDIVPRETQVHVEIRFEDSMPPNDPKRLSRPFFGKMNSSVPCMLQVSAVREALDHSRDGCGLYFQSLREGTGRGSLTPFGKGIDCFEIIFNGTGQGHSGRVVHS
jgi:hypothetical protein